VAARTIRNVLVDHARKRESRERGESLSIVASDAEAALSRTNELDILVLEDALARLAELHPRQARVVELRFFGGLGLDEIAAELGVSARTVDDDWSVARAWLSRELNRGAAP
jgi:RNA polymerase sigma factor (TIGR02999 family)